MTTKKETLNALRRLHRKILKSKLAESVTEEEMTALVAAEEIVKQRAQEETETTCDVKKGASMYQNKTPAYRYLILNLRQYQAVTSLLLQVPATMSSQTVQEHLQHALNDAEADGVTGSLADIPDTYLANYQITRIPAEAVERPFQEIRPQTPWESHGIAFATCEDCNAFEQGFCTKHGELNSAIMEAPAEDCCHGDDVYILIVEDVTPPIRLHINNRKGLLAEEVADLIAGKAAALWHDLDMKAKIKKSKEHHTLRLEPTIQ